MSNRFHNKWHRKNHHTYGNLSNPDAAHDPIASSEQPFLGEFVLQGALCAVAPMSAFAGYFYSNFTALCAFAGYRAIQAKAFSFPGGDSIGIQVDSQNIAISAYAPAIGLNVYSMTNAISAYGKGRGAFIGSDIKGAEIQGGSIGAEVYSSNKAISANGFLMGAEIYSNRRAISAYGSLIGAEIYGVGRALSAMSPNLGIEVYSNQRAISAYGSAIGAEIYSPNVGISAYSPRIAIRAIAPNKNQNYTDIRALDVTGYSFFDGDVEITGSLSANGYISRFDTYVVVTSSTYIENKGTDTALTVIQRGNVPVAHFYDDGNSALFIDGTPSAPGYVGINTATPNERLTIVGNISGYSDHISFGNSRASGTWSFSEGTSQATGNISHAEGSATTASGLASHSEGFTTTSSASASHAEGSWTRASGEASHAEGNQTTASGIHSHAEGNQTIASGIASHAAGIRSTASQNYSYIWSGDNTLGTNAQTSLDRQYLIYAPSGVYIPRGIVGIGTGTDYPNINYPLTVNGRISSKGLDIWNDSILKLGYFPAVNDGAEIFFQSDQADYGRLIIQTIDNADSTIVLRQRDQNGPNNYNRLVVGSDGNIGIATGTLTSVETFNTNLAVYGTLSSYSAYVGDRLYFGSGLAPDTNLYKSATNTLKTDDNLIVDLNLTVNGNSNLGTDFSDTNTIIGTTNVNVNATTAATNIGTGTTTGAVSIGNASGNLTLNGNTGSLTTAGTLGITTGNTVNINTTNGRATNINTGSGAVLTTIGNAGTVDINGATLNVNSTQINLGDAATDTVTINAGPVNIPYATTAADALILGTDTNLYRSAADTLRTDDSIVAPNQVYTDGSSVITGTLGDIRYGNLSRNNTLGSVNTTITLTNIVGGVALDANSVYDITAVAVLSIVGNTATVGTRVGFEGDGTLVFNYYSIDEMNFNSSSATTNANNTYSGVPNSTTISANTTTTAGATGTTHYYRRRVTLRTGATGGTLFWRHGVNTAGGTNSSTPATGSFLLARKII